MIWCNARDEPNLSRCSCSGLVAYIIQNELGKAAITWNQLLLLILWYLIQKVVEPQPDIHHAGVEAVNGPRFNQNQRCVRSGKKWHVFIQLQISATYVFWSRQVNGVALQSLYKVGPCDYLRMPAKIIKENDLCVLSSKPSRITIGLVNAI